MKIFSDLDIVDHTGHGVPIIIEKYGRVAFEISDNHIIVTIPFDLEVMKSINVGVNVGVNSIEISDVKLTERQTIMVSVIKSNPMVTAKQMSETLSVTVRTIERDLALMQKAGIIRHEGSDKTGVWVILEQGNTNS